MKDDPNIEERLRRLAQGDREAEAELIPLLYEELRELAAQKMRRERMGHTLQPTAMVHEVYLRLVGEGAHWDGREHFLAVAATTMRRVLINHARDRSRDKRGGGVSRVTLDRMVEFLEDASIDTIALDDALTRLAELSPRQARVVELRVFGGLTISEAARALDLGETTVKSEWTFARAWLKRELSA